MLLLESDCSPDGNPADKDYAREMWLWIEDQLASSDDFDYLLVAGHYQIVDSYGYYDKALTKHLLPLLKKYKAQAYIQAHRFGFLLTTVSNYYIQKKSSLKIPRRHSSSG